MRAANYPAELPSAGHNNMPTISSIHNPRVKNAVRLRDSRQRQKQQLIIVEGVRETQRAIAGGVDLLEFFVCQELCASPQAQALLNQVPAAVQVHPVTASVFEKLAFGRRSEGVLAIARTPVRRLADIVLPPQALVAVLEGVEKPGNVGAVLRSADGAGISALIVVDGRTDLYNPQTIRASLGTVFSLPVCATTDDEAVAWLRQQGLAIFAARVDGAVPYTEADFRQAAAIVLGSEAAGLSAAWEAADVRPIRVPMRGLADSLNVSATAAILFYEALRQRGEAELRA